MAHSVTITTPMPTLDELGKELGLSKAEQNFLIRLVDEKGLRIRSTAVRKSRTKSAQTSSANAGLTVKLRDLSVRTNG